ncbi:hypothetical protein [uncultured Maribacter sp.]|uniref:hypothetical protein n=1 Tax=uncultured Maribacter sp. TaxID=431308 RepID=UPI002620F7D1|nr:hypothetical protein [uncultured Maribacter sp.]
MKKVLSKIIIVLFLLITVTSVENWSSIKLAPTLTFSLIRIFLFTIPLVWAYFIFKNPLNKPKIGAVSLFLGLIIVTGIRSILIAKGKAEWYFILNYFPAMLSFISIYYLDYPFLFKKINFYWFRIAPLLCLLWFPFMNSIGEVLGYFLPLLILYLLFIQVIPTKAKGILLALTTTIIVVCYLEGARSHVLKFGFASLFGASLYFKSAWFYVKAIKIGRILFLITPIALFFLGITNIFNVFKMQEYISGDFTFERTDTYGDQRQESLVDDTRTFLYEEAIISAINNKYVLFGRSFARGYDSYFQVKRAEKIGDIVSTDTIDRISEVAIINIFTWMGITGVVLYFFVFLKVTYLAIYRSNNSYIKIVGLYLSFRWMYGWVEDFQRLDISTLTLWMLLAICLSKSLRKLNNREVARYIQSIFKFN